MVPRRAVRSSCTIIGLLWSHVALRPCHQMTLCCDTHWHDRKPYPGSCPNKWIRVIDVLLSASHSYFTPYFSFISSFSPILCFCLSLLTVIMGVAYRMGMNSRLLPQLNNKALSKNFKLSLLYPQHYQCQFTLGLVCERTLPLSLTSFVHTTQQYTRQPSVCAHKSPVCSSSSTICTQLASIVVKFQSVNTPRQHTRQVTLCALNSPVNFNL